MPFLQAVAMESLSHLEDYSQQHVSNIAWAFAKLLVHEQPLLMALASKIGRELSSAQPQTLSSMAWCLARLQIRDRSFLDGVARAAQERMAQFAAQEPSKKAGAKCRRRSPTAPGPLQCWRSATRRSFRAWPQPPRGAWPQNPGVLGPKSIKIHQNLSTSDEILKETRLKRGLCQAS